MSPSSPRNRRLVRRPWRARAAVASLITGAALVGLAVPAQAKLPPHDHVVAPGDTLSEVAEERGTTVAALAEANGIADPDVVIAGSTLAVPEPLAVPADEATGSASSSSPVPASRRWLEPAFDRWATANGFRPSLLKALCYLESGWQTSVVSSTGADGVCQLMPDTEDHMEALIGHELDSSDGEDNVRLGARFLKWLLVKTDGDVREAVGAYYQGYAAMQRYGPYDETEDYVDSVLALERRFD